MPNKLVLEQLSMLQGYYKQTYNEVQIKRMTEQLSKMPEWLLVEVVNEWTDTEPKWLPRGADLLRMALEKSGVSHIQHLEGLGGGDQDPSDFTRLNYFELMSLFNDSLRELDNKKGIKVIQEVERRETGVPA